MTTRRTVLSYGLGSAAFAAFGSRALAQAVPAGYPANYADVVAKAKAEGKLAIYTSTDLAQGQKLLDAFKAAFPGITPEWNDLGTTSVYNRLISEAAAKQVGCDVAWSSGIDLQIAAVDKGLAAVYASPEAAKVPKWAQYKGAGYGTTYEPAAVVYNKRLLPAELVPKSHADLLRILKDNKDKLDGKVATYDPEKSGTGFMFATDGLAHVPNYWDLATAFGAAKGKVYGGSGTMREKVISGEHVLAFDVIGSYAVEWAKADANLGVSYLADHVPVFSRVMLIAKDAPHPNAAQVFLDFTLSQAGQKALAAGGLAALRGDVEGVDNAASVEKQINGKVAPIALDVANEYAEPKKRAEFFRLWKKAMQG